MSRTVIVRSESVAIVLTKNDAAILRDKLILLQRMYERPTPVPRVIKDLLMYLNGAIARATSEENA